MLSPSMPRLMSFFNNPNNMPLFSPPSLKHFTNSQRNECFYPPPLSNTPKLRFSTACAASDEIHLLHQLRPELMPKHVAIILDGNGRWAKSRGLSVKDGHRAALLNLSNIVVPICSHFGIRVLTVFAFSIENWKRSQMEVDFLMKYTETFIHSHVMELIERHNIRFSVIGNKSLLPEPLQSTISSAEEASRANGGMHLVLAVSYSGQNEIAMACKKIAMLVEKGVLEVKDIDENVVGSRMMTSLAEFPNPDLLIRTSGEMRISNFMLWQLAYSELYFSNKMFPDFGKEDLVEALASFQRRDRRYGKRKN